MKEFSREPLRGDVQGDPLALRTPASMYKNHLIIPLLRVVRWRFPCQFVPTRSGGMDDFMLKRLRADIRAIRDRDPAARNTFEVLLLYSGLHAIMLHRPAHFLYQHRFYFLARLLSQIARFFTGIEIHPGAKIGIGVMIDHGSGIVIGETAEVGDGCTLYQGVTLGGTGKDKGKRHPTLGKNVMVGSGAKILGPFTVGDNVKVAAGAVVLEPIPANSTAVGVPARVIKQNGQRVCPPMDQVHIPDPVSQEICALKCRLEKLEKLLKETGKVDPMA